MSNARFIFGLALLAALLVFASMPPRAAQHGGRVTIQYWEKWSGFEATTMQEMVDDFNASQDKIWVDFSSVSQLDHKLMLATAGGVPPDVAGVWSHAIPVLAENNGLTPLDEFAAGAGIKREQYIDVYWQLCSYRDHLWALPSTPASLALIYNKKMFREAGLDPEKPPRSIKELEEYNEKLTKHAADGSLTQIGHIPQIPGWYGAYWGYWFGGSLWDGKDKLTATSPENLAAYKWIESYPQRFGKDKLLAMRDGFGNYGSPRDPFFSGHVAMVLQGPWINNYILKYGAKDFEWGVAAFPSVDPDRLPNVTIVECDAYVIPHGARHPNEAFEFIKYMNSQKPMEKLALLHDNFSPLVNCSPDFFTHHPNPHIDKFLELAKSPNARFAPRVTTWTQYMNDMQDAVERISTENATPEVALRDVQGREQAAFERRVLRWAHIEPELTAEWSQPVTTP